MKKLIQITTFSYFSMKTCTVSTYFNFLSEAIHMSAHKIFFCGEIRNISVFIWSKKYLTKRPEDFLQLSPNMPNMSF